MTYGDYEYEQEEDPYAEIREVLAPELAEMPADELEDYLAETFPYLDAEEMEEFLRTIRQVGNTVAPYVQQAMPGIIQGATTGMALGPKGALAGAALGGFRSLMQPGATATQQRPAPATAPTRPMPAPRAPAAPPQAVPAGGSPAAAQLLAILNRPEVVQALIAMAMGQPGARTVPVGNTNAPVAAVTNMVSSLAQRASEEYHAMGMSTGADVPEYLLDAYGRPRPDIDSPDERADILWAELVREMRLDLEWWEEGLDEGDEIF